MDKYICIEGNIGSGKTTLAKALAKKANAKLLLEEFEDNGFLQKFYANPERYAFPLEMSFLSDRFKQLQQVLAQSEDLFQNHVIADYSIFKCILFAKNNLEEQDFKLYNYLFQKMIPRLRQPDLVVFLQRPLASIRKNIHKRSREYEMNISDAYLMDIGEKYMNLFKGPNMPRVLLINADKYDFLNNENDVADILSKVLENAE